MEAENSMRRPWQRSKKDSGPLDGMVLVEGSREVSGFKTNLEDRADGGCSQTTLKVGLTVLLTDHTEVMRMLLVSIKPDEWCYHEPR